MSAKATIAAPIAWSRSERTVSRGRPHADGAERGESGEGEDTTAKDGSSAGWVGAVTAGAAVSSDRDAGRLVALRAEAGDEAERAQQDLGPAEPDRVAVPAGTLRAGELEPRDGVDRLGVRPSRRRSGTPRRRWRSGCSTVTSTPGRIRPVSPSATMMRIARRRADRAERARVARFVVGELARVVVGHGRSSVARACSRRWASIRRGAARGAGPAAATARDPGRHRDRRRLDAGGRRVRRLGARRRQPPDPPCWSPFRSRPPSPRSTRRARPGSRCAPGLGRRVRLRPRRARPGGRVLGRASSSSSARPRRSRRSPWSAAATCGRVSSGRSRSALVLVLAALNATGVRSTAIVSAVAAAVVIVVLVAVLGVSLPGRRRRAARRRRAPARRARRPTGLIFFAFAGYARVATLGEEVRDPVRVLPRAVLLAVATVFVLSAATLRRAARRSRASSGSPRPRRRSPSWRRPAGSSCCARPPGSPASDRSPGCWPGSAAPGWRWRGTASCRRRWRASAGARRRRSSRTSAVAVVAVAAVLLLEPVQVIGVSACAVLGYYAIAHLAALRAGPAARTRRAASRSPDWPDACWSPPRHPGPRCSASRRHSRSPSGSAPWSGGRAPRSAGRIRGNRGTSPPAGWGTQLCPPSQAHLLWGCRARSAERPPCSRTGGLEMAGARNPNSPSLEYPNVDAYPVRATTRRRVQRVAEGRARRGGRSRSGVRRNRDLARRAGRAGEPGRSCRRPPRSPPSARTPARSRPASAPSPPPSSVRRAEAPSRRPRTPTAPARASRRPTRSSPDWPTAAPSAAAAPVPPSGTNPGGSNGGGNGGVAVDGPPRRRRRRLHQPQSRRHPGDRRRWWRRRRWWPLDRHRRRRRQRRTPLGHRRGRGHHGQRRQGHPGGDRRRRRRRLRAAPVPAARTARAPASTASPAPGPPAATAARTPTTTRAAAAAAATRRWRWRLDASARTAARLEISRRRRWRWLQLRRAVDPARRGHLDPERHQLDRWAPSCPARGQRRQRLREPASGTPASTTSPSTSRSRPVNTPINGTVTWTVAVTNLGPSAMTQGDTVTHHRHPSGRRRQDHHRDLGLRRLERHPGSRRGHLHAPPSARPCPPASTARARTRSARAPRSGVRGLDVGETLTVTYTQLVTEAVGTTLTNTATVVDRQSGDTNDTDTAATTVVAPPGAVNDVRSGNAHRRRRQRPGHDERHRHPRSRTPSRCGTRPAPEARSRAPTSSPARAPGPSPPTSSPSRPRPATRATRRRSPTASRPPTASAPRRR